ncbi:MAG: sialate O-acetylesterase [Lentisphaeria bacterium]|nr:sialate O-acetylesterase [Lentisphaeria bacterium]
MNSRHFGWGRPAMAGIMGGGGWCRLTLLALLSLPAAALHAEVVLPATFADNMLLQRDKPLPVYGRAKPGEKVVVAFAGQRQEGTADAAGVWRVTLAPLAASAEGRDMTVTGENSIVLKNVLVGDLWLASGQSNMQVRIREAMNAKEEIAAAKYDTIRFFMVKTALASSPQQDPAGEWKLCTPENAPEFSAVGYFFARELVKTHGVPIGIVNCAIGSSSCQAWVAADVLRSNPALPQPLAIPAEEYKDFATYVGVRKKIYEDAAYKDPGMLPECAAWAESDFADDDWRDMKVPGSIESQGLKIDGAMWYRAAITVPESWAGKNASLYLGLIAQNSVAYFNGVEIGRKENNGGIWIFRTHPVPGNIVKAGRNVIAVRVFNDTGPGGFHPTYPRPQYLGQGNEKVMLPAVWRFKVERAYEPRALSRTLPEPYHLPTGFYNAMIAPLASMPLRGFIWYQGESNAGNPKQHDVLFPTLIRSWRELWQDDQLPFYYVQLAAYQKPQEQPVEGGWPGFRESQTKALAVPLTGMASAIDIGDPHNVHPMNKQEVGRRLALWARRDCYGEKDLAVSGPLYSGFAREGAAIRVRFSHCYDGLAVRGDKLKGFAIAGADMKFVWAEARIDGQDSVLVWSKDVPEPAHVRYAWANNPDCTLINQAGLPAGPFRTDK